MRWLNIAIDRLFPQKGSEFLIKAVRPGITGLWQISDRSDICHRERVKIDAHGAINWIFWQDLGISSKTVFIVCVRKGAY